MTSILFLMDRIYSNILGCNYLRNEKFFSIFFFFLHFGSLDSILKIFKVKVTLIVDVFLNLWTSKNVFT